MTTAAVPAAVPLSYGFWRRAFGGDAKALGKTIVMNDEPAQVVGVLPKDFEMPQLGDIDVMLPARLDASLPCWRIPVPSCAPSHGVARA